MWVKTCRHPFTLCGFHCVDFILSSVSSCLGPPIPDLHHWMCNPRERGELSVRGWNRCPGSVGLAHLLSCVMQLLPTSHCDQGDGVFLLVKLGTHVRSELTHQDTFLKVEIRIIPERKLLVFLFLFIRIGRFEMPLLFSPELHLCCVCMCVCVVLFCSL